MNINTERRTFFMPEVNMIPTVEQPIETEFLIPEYCPDIIKILKCEINPRILSKNLSGNLLEIEGCAEITVIYCAEDNKISSVITKYNFSKSLDNKNFEGGEIDISIKKGHLTCRQTATRRIEIRGSLQIDVSIITKKQEEIIFDIDRADIQLLRDSIPATTELYFNEKQLLIEDEIWLSSGKPEIKYIMRQSAVPIISECKLIGEKAVVKGIIKLDILYCSIEDKCINFSDTINFSQIIEVKTSGEDCSASARSEICFLEIKPISSNNSETGFNVTIKLNVSVKSFCESEIPIIKDAYSTKFASNMYFNKLLFRKKLDLTNDKIIVKKTCTLNESSISEIIDLWSTINLGKSKIDNKEFTITGNVNASLLYLKNDNSPDLLDIKFDFDYKKLVNIKDREKLKIIPNIIPTNYSYTVLSSNQIELHIELSIETEMFNEYECEYVNEVEISDEKLISEESIIIYYCSEDENVWDISKRFSTQIQKLKDQNNLTDDIVNSQSVLIIPRM